MIKFVTYEIDALSSEVAIFSRRDRKALIKIEIKILYIL